MIKVVCFDLGKVIVDFDYGGTVQELIKVSPLPVSEVTRILSNNSLINDYETGKISTSDFYRSVSQLLRLDVSLGTFKQLWGSMFLPDPLIPESLLTSLKANYRLLLLSNTNEIHLEFLTENYPILRHIEEKVLSYQVGYMKPARRIYQVTVERAGVAPEEILFTDDREENIEAAREMGIQAIRFESEEQLRREMRLLGVSMAGKV